jgi:hypothetical protein
MRCGCTSLAFNCLRSNPMLDLLVLVLGAVFFAATILYAYACERL